MIIKSLLLHISIRIINYQRILFSEFLNGKSIICSPTVLLKTEKLKGIGGYNNQYFAEDFNLWIKILSKYEIIFTNQILVKYRLHSKSTTNLNWDRIIMDCYDSIESIENSKYLKEKQREATLIKKIQLSKDILKIKLKRQNNLNEFIKFFLKILKGIMNHPSRSEYEKRYIIKIEDELLIFIFKKILN